MLIFTMVFSVFLKIPTGDIPYPLFSYTAILPWTYFATSITFGTPSLVNNMTLITKVKIPREILPISSVIVAFIDFLIAAIIFILLFIIYQLTPYWTLLWVVPLLLIQSILAIGIVLFSSGINVFYRDIRFVIPLALQLWMYATPIIYPVDMVPFGLRIFYYLNPMVSIIEGYRSAILVGTPPNIYGLIYSTIISIVILIVGYWLFKKLEPIFADII